MYTYKERLDRLWDAHRAPREPDAPTVVSTFAGCGGSSLGYSAAGYRELLAVEWESHAAEVFRANFPGVPVFEGDIADVGPDDLDLPEGGLDVLDGSPPCQGFSMNGRRAMDDPRNRLFLHYVRLAELWRPRVLVMENVTGMVRGRMKSTYREVLAAMRGAGYRVQARVVSAHALGVPQRRQRLIFVGVRDDLDLAPVFPAPSPRLVTLREAFADLDHRTRGLVEYPTGRAASLAPHILPGQTGDRPLVAAGRKGNFFSIGRAAWDRPSPTVVKTFNSGIAGMLHPDADRYLGTVELSRLQSFPDAFDWGDSTYANIHARIGNSVPPMMMRAVSGTIRREILGG